MTAAGFTSGSPLLDAPHIEHLTRRDRLVEADRVEIDIGSRHDHKSAFQFSVNAGGALTDAVLFNDTDSSSDWDDNWDARVARTARGWSAELRIPLRILRFPSAPLQAWDFQARRYISERQEIDEWSFIPRDVATTLLASGTDFAGSARVDALPRVHAVASAERGAAPRRDGDAELCAGQPRAGRGCAARQS